MCEAATLRRKAVLLRAASVFRTFSVRKKKGTERFR
jgi:hypothetical protein